jgi:F-type H+-transporting ATPase subunit epsilon
MHLEVITPNGSVFSEEVKLCQVSGLSGKFELLPRHTEILAALAIGESKIIRSDGSQEYLFIAGGFLENRNNRITILAEAAETADKIDTGRAERARDRAQKRLVEKNRVEIDVTRAEAALQRALQRLQIARRSH